MMLAQKLEDVGAADLKQNVAPKSRTSLKQKAECFCKS